MASSKMASTSRKALKLLKRSFSSKDSGKEDIKIFSYNAEELEVHQPVTGREEALSDVLNLSMRIN